jgi:sigma-E factor negative regulatory protein RseA
MTDSSIERAERVSALTDGQLHGDEFAQALADLAQSEEARAHWGVYHLVGEAMRSAGPHVRPHDPDFVKRLRQRMMETTIEIVAIDATPVSAVGQKHIKITSANDARWRRVVGLASVALVSVLAWQGLPLRNTTEVPVGHLAQNANVPTVASVSPSDAGRLKQRPAGRPLLRADGTSALAASPEPSLMIRDPQLDALLAAQRQYGGASALQVPSVFLRNATFEASGR